MERDASKVSREIVNPKKCPGSPCTDVSIQQPIGSRRAIPQASSIICDVVLYVYSVSTILR